MPNRRIICWQGWRLEIPHRWDPVKLEGDHAQGYALLADTLRPRLGLRWQTMKRKTDPVRAVQLAMKTEVGQLAATEAETLTWSGDNWQSPLLYVEPHPPGRDVFCTFSSVSGRLLQVVYHARRREHILAGAILPLLSDLPVERAAPWSIFDLNCVIPGGMKLKSHRLNAGDLSMTFADRFNEVTIRQIAVAQIALRRQPLDRWISDQQKSTRRYHRPTDVIADTSITIDNRQLPGRMTHAVLRMRYALMWNEPRVQYTLGFHYADRNRLILLQGSDESLLRAIANTVGSRDLSNC